MLPIVNYCLFPVWLCKTALDSGIPVDLKLKLSYCYFHWSFLTVHGTRLALVWSWKI
uniref:Uncharacterized protein n=1 Tax=Rhizophora mucronata TaxID=61149 RepID=A0A2P2QBC2_RHIMU